MKKPHLGALCAAEGSMLGGRVLARQLDDLFGSDEDGRRFFLGSVDDRVNWARFIDVLKEAWAPCRPLDLAISGALRTFKWFEQCLSPLVEVKSESSQVVHIKCG